MAGFFSRIGNKVGHVGSNVFNSAKNWGATGIFAGAVFGVFTALTGGATLFAGLLTVCGYGLGTGVLGAGLGAAWGGAKGLLTRSKQASEPLVEEMQAPMPPMGQAQAIETPVRQPQPAQAASRDALDEVRALATKLGGMQVSQAQEGTPSGMNDNIPQRQPQPQKAAPTRG